MTWATRLNKTHASAELRACTYAHQRPERCYVVTKSRHEDEEASRRHRANGDVDGNRLCVGVLDTFAFAQPVGRACLALHSAPIREGLT